MPPVESLVFVFVAGVITDVATGMGVIPLVFIATVQERLYVLLWGAASGIMLSMSLVGLVPEGLAHGSISAVAVGAIVGAVLIQGTSRLLGSFELHPHSMSDADLRRLVLIVGTLTVHSIPEGVAIGVAFADLRVGPGGLTLFGLSVPVLAVVVTVSIAIHNVPEGLAIAIPLKTQGLSNRKLFTWAIVSSAPQPILAVIAFYFVRVARQTLPFGLGFAAGAMVFLVLFELLPEAYDQGTDLRGHGRGEIALGLLIGGGLMTAFLLIVGQ